MLIYTNPLPMEKKKIQLAELKVSSFTVIMDEQARKTTKGGDIPVLDGGPRGGYTPARRRRFGSSFTDHKSQRPGAGVFLSGLSGKK